MPQYLKLGSLPRKRHIAHKYEPGFRNEGIYYEEVVTTQGFSRAYSICYHLRPPTRVRAIEPAGEVRTEAADADTLRHYHLRSGTIPSNGDIVAGRVPFLFNADIVISRCRPGGEQDELYRNATADEILFVHRGRGVLHTMFGLLPFKPFDYVVIPRCTTYRIEFDGGIEPDLLVVESTGNVVLPSRYLNPDGQLRLGAPYYERDFHGPREPLVIDREEETTVLIKDGARLTRYTLASHPFDVVGWDGLVYPYTFNADDFEPITGTIHQPPPVQQTFETSGFVICTFAPRMLDTHPEAIKVPYAHSNVESDEVLYYVRGHFGSRRGVEEGSFTLHPRGLPHGPHPGTIVASKAMTRTDELAVMIDTFRPLNVAKPAIEYDDPSYPLSWLEWRHPLVVLSTESVPLQIDVALAPVVDVYHTLVGVVTPRPIAWVTSVDRDGRVNLAPFSFFNAFGANPPVVVFSPTLRRDGSKKDTLLNVEATGEFVINAAIASLAKQINASSADLPPGESEVEFVGLRTVPSVKVKPPRLAESPVNLECTLRQVIPIGQGAIAANLVIGEVVMMHVADSVLDASGKVDPRKLQTIARLGADWYCHSTDLFAMTRP